MTGRSGTVGYQPGISVGRVNPEKYKYEKMYTFPEYRKRSPGLDYIPKFIDLAKPRWGATVIDFGSGLGRAGREMCRAGMKVTMLDIAANALDPEVRESLSDDLKFVQHDLETPVPFIAEYGFCADVMEHIPEDKVDIVLSNILGSAKEVFFVICLAEEIHGKPMIGEPLHLTVRPSRWWIDKLTSMGFKVKYEKKLMPAGWHEDVWMMVYGSSWDDIKEITKEAELNTSKDVIRDHIRTNCRGGWKMVEPFEEQETEVMILGGGPTLSEYEDQIVRMRNEGVKLVTLNGTYNWCLERGIKPSATVLVDAREFNKRFVQPVVEGVKYFIGGQCHPAVFDGLPKENTYIWYDGSDRVKEILQEEGFDGYYPVPGGSTVLLRALPLLQLLGYKRFHLFGCDSCLMAPVVDGKGRAYHHHAFPQPENDGQSIMPVILTGGKVFYCNPWMALQAREFIEIVKQHGESMEMIVYGNGLLAQIINTGAELEEEG